MSPTSLVSGSTEAVEKVAAALRSAGADVVTVTDLDRLADEVRQFAPGSFDSYVQLPVAIVPTGDTVVSRVHAFLENGLLTRFRFAAAALPLLSDSGRVVLVGGHTLGDRTAPDDQAARVAFLEVLAHAMRADKAPHKLRVRVVTHSQTPEDIAQLALTGETPKGRHSRVRDLTAREAEKSYEDWHTEVMGLVAVEF